MFRKLTALTAVSVLLLLSIFGMASAHSTVAGNQPWQDKTDAWVLDTADDNGETEFLVFLTEQADLSQARALDSKLEKGQYVFDTLTTLAERSQAPVRRALEAKGIDYRPFWIANMIWVRGDMQVISELAQRHDVAHLYANPRVHLDIDPPDAIQSSQMSSPTGIEWNISHVSAPDVWAEGITGEGAVIGGQDTGYDWDHPALKNQYRGWDGSSAQHDYNWHDAIHSSTGSCPGDSPAPCDDHNHGTHTMGTMVGDDGGSNQIGMAPGARWIGCRNMDQGNGTPATYAECYEWFVAPTRLDGSKPVPAMAPHVINNSWSCPPSEGCTDPNMLLTVVHNLRAAGIVSAHSAGNEGPFCSTVADQAGTYGESFSVGATNNGDAIANFSSRGPVTVDGSDRMKPNISAPGVDIRSSVRGGGYEDYWDGTSMAAPHVAGLVALLVSANPALASDVDGLEDIIEQTAVPLTTNQRCGDDGPTDVPNNVYGWGRIDALAAYESLCLAPLPVGDVAISTTGGDVQLTWDAATGADEYEVWHTDDAPYFLPTAGADCAASPDCTVVTTNSYSSASLDETTYYVVLSANSCGATNTTPSQRTGQFKSALQPGQS